MSDVIETFDFVCIGGGPAGQKAAVHAAEAGKRVLLVECSGHAGGACVRRGTIPSKTLREAAISLDNMRRRTGDVFSVNVSGDVKLAALMSRKDVVIGAHERYMDKQIERAGVVLWKGRARFISPNELEVVCVGGELRSVRAGSVLIATGSRPRNPLEIPIDHENIVDSDSVLSLAYLPQSMIVIGAGVIACEYASVFANIGCKVTMVDSGKLPLGFLDPELTARFLSCFEATGSSYIGGVKVKRVEWDGLSEVVAELDDGRSIRAEKALFCLGRVANVEGLNIEAAGLKTNSRGQIEVDAQCRTAVPGIYAAGDVIGPPGLASAAMEQGRRAAIHALGLDPGEFANVIPSGIYTIPEMASVGMTEAQAVEQTGGATVGRGSYHELARGQIAAIPDGLLKIVADGQGRRLLGVHIVGEGAAELVHIGEMALLARWDVDRFIETIFNFPTLAEAYRVAALDIVAVREAVLAT